MPEEAARTILTTPLERAIREYIEARDAFLRSVGVRGLRHYRFATERLFAVFTAGVPNDNPDVLWAAFNRFRTTLVSDNGEKHPPASEMVN